MLKQDGFGVLTDIDVETTLKQKVGDDMPPYRILGACNRSLVHRDVPQRKAKPMSRPRFRDQRVSRR
ncbi:MULTISPECIES: DUF302 domain-containing protein [Immundisolibacter]|uniref:DUF302 domain-containing protein n=1 Tax=Immundisolibacter cernigliae TaxID=1810504 RepID=A0A1B1YTA1_9GAMM|nr:MULTISPECIES: DUF302 domain-containing protein [Immundisolibacter]ANX03917.1 hypothetical protein PG2T_06715 [Immundisolibacter cernigliae]MEA3220045.1 hypothetical protein [Immundisolibacter sp.]